MLYNDILHIHPFIHSVNHSHTDGGGYHARCQPAHREQFGVQFLAQGHVGEVRESRAQTTRPTPQQPAPPPMRPISHQRVGRTGNESHLHLFLNVFQVLDELQRIIQPNNAHYISEMRKRWDDFYSKVQFYGVMKKVMKPPKTLDGGEVTVYSTLICPSLYFEIS